MQSIYKAQLREKKGTSGSPLQAKPKRKEGKALGQDEFHIPDTVLDQNQLRSQAMAKRVENWAMNYMESPELQRALKSGSIPLIHPAFHSFRPSNPLASQRISSKIFIPGKNYQEEKFRILRSEKKARETIDDRDCYRKEPFWFRDSIPQNEIHKPMRYCSAFGNKPKKLQNETVFPTSPIQKEPRRPCFKTGSWTIVQKT